jgi:drug/metabolite transporter (DMT)-like permease
MSAAAVPRWALGAAALGLFLLWSNSFIAISYLLGGDRTEAQFTWVGLTAARFLLIAPICAVYCLVRRRREAVRILRAHPRRLLASGLLAVPGYNLALYYGQGHGIPAPIASLTTALLPLMVIVLAGVFLHERITRRHLAGFGISVLGMGIVASAGKGTMGHAYPLLVVITALAPLSWSLYSVLARPLAGRVDSLVWTYLAITVGSVFLLPLLPGPVWRQWTALSGPGWVALVYLSLPCTVLGFAVWTWLLKHLPASTVGLTVFLNPPLTTVSKLALGALVPSVFVFSVGGRDILGGTLALVGLGIAVLPIRRRRGIVPGAAAPAVPPAAIPPDHAG